MEKHPLHIKNPELQNSEEVERAVDLLEQKTGEELPNDPSARIEAYTDRLENIFLNPDTRVRERNLEMLRDKIYDALIIKTEKFPESYFELQQRIARERGQAVEVIPQNVREQMMDTAIEDQKASLDAWMDYLTSEDAVYPAWFKYYVWKNITKLSQFDKERGEFKKRTDTTVAPFPDIYREPLAQIADLYEKVKEDNKNLKDPEIQEAFSKKFPSLYAELIQKSLIASIERKDEIQGTWVKYAQGDETQAEKLYDSLQGKGTGWCTAGKSTAETQIESGDFYVYYSNDEKGNPTQPRLAIRMNGKNRIGEVRGVLSHQNVEPIMQGVLDEKLQEFGNEAESYRKKSADMKNLTELDSKKQAGEEFTKEDIKFLYEMDSRIEGFGYQRDPRIKELQDPERDMPIFFDCEKSQIARDISEIKDNTKVFVGPLVPRIFEAIQRNKVEHIYFSFPGEEIKREKLEIGGLNGEELLTKMREKKISGCNPDPYNGESNVEFMMKSKDFTTSEVVESEEFVWLKDSDLGFDPKIKDVKPEEIYKRIEELGLELCPAETAAQFCLKHVNQPGNEDFNIGMKKILDSNGRPRLFNVHRTAGKLWLSGIYDLDHHLHDDLRGIVRESMYRLPKLKNLEA